MSLTKLNLKGLINNTASHLVGGGSLFTTGKVWYVDSVTGSNGNVGEDPKLPLATVAQAYTSARANKGDKIVVMPNHAETVTATSINLNKAGITVINLGNGKSDRPTYTFSTAAATITVSAADNTWIGGYFLGNFLDVASAFTIGAAKGFTLQGGLFEDSSSILNFLSIVTTGATDNDADDLTVVGNKWYGLNTTPLAVVSILAAEIRPTITDNIVNLAATSGGEFITLATKIIKGAVIARNIHNVVGATGTTTGIFLTGSGTTSTGVVHDNFVASLDTTTELLFTASTGLVYFRNEYTGVADKSGYILPAIDSAA